MDTENLQNLHPTGKSGRDRLELASRGLLGLALLTAVAWALIDGGLRWGI